MKKLIVLLTVLLVLVGCSSKKAGTEGELRIFSVGEYIDNNKQQIKECCRMIKQLIKHRKTKEEYIEHIIDQGRKG